MMGHFREIEFHAPPYSGSMSLPIVVGALGGGALGWLGSFPMGLPVWLLAGLGAALGAMACGFAVHRLQQRRVERDAQDQSLRDTEMRETLEREREKQLQAARASGALDRFGKATRR